MLEMMPLEITVQGQAVPGDGSEQQATVMASAWTDTGDAP